LKKYTKKEFKFNDFLTWVVGFLEYLYSDVDFADTGETELVLYDESSSCTLIKGDGNKWGNVSLDTRLRASLIWSVVTECPLHCALNWKLFALEWTTICNIDNVW
jgi:hypothetical protein